MISGGRLYFNCGIQRPHQYHLNFNLIILLFSKRYMWFDFINTCSYFIFQKQRMLFLEGQTKQSSSLSYFLTESGTQPQRG